MEKESVKALDLETGQYIEIPRESLSFRPSVYGVILKDRNILLVPARHGYTLPGGAIKQGESIEDALGREIYEETGLQIGTTNLLAVTQDYYISAYD